MFERFFSSIYDLPLIRAFKINTTPRWIILLVDMLIAAISYVLVMLSEMYAHRTVESMSMFLGNGILVVAVFFIVSYVTKSYTCVIRLSVIEDLYRTILAVAAATGLLLAINVGWIIVGGAPLIRLWNICIIGTITFSIMMIERLMIKYFYMKLTAVTKNRRHVLVLGTSLESLILANALKNEIGGQYEPVGLLSIKEGKENEVINGFSVYRFNPETIVSIVMQRSIYALIFDARITEQLRDKAGLADVLMRSGVKLLAINRVEEYELDDGRQRTEGDISSFVREVQIEDLLGRAPIVLNNSLVHSHIRNVCVLITGACGSIGSEIVRQVAAYGASKIVLVDQAETPMHDLALEMQQHFPESDIVLFIGDVQNRQRMEQAFALYRPKYVFHAAAYKHVPMMEINPSEAVLTNVLGTRNMADLAVKYDVFKFVMISTDKAVNPTNVMGCTKRIAEIYCQSLFKNISLEGNKSTQFITTRFGNVLGSNGSVIPLFRRQIEAGGPVTVTHRDIIRYFMTIPEACSLVLEAGCMGHGGEIYIFDMGEPVKIYDLAQRMISLAGLKPGIDIEIKEIGLRPGEKLYEELLSDKERNTATVNKKIMIARVRTYDYLDACNHIEQIVHLAEQGNIRQMIYAMKTFVPEYKSNQSAEFEAIDRAIEQEKANNTPSQATENFY